jgi:hypothetical protein
MLDGWPRLIRSYLLSLVSLPFVAVSVAAFAAALIQSWSARGKPFDESAADRRLFTFVLLFTSMTSAVSLDQAAESPQVGLMIVGVAVLWTIFWLSPSRRTITTTTSGVIQRDPGTVFAFVADDVNLPRYIALIEAVEKISSGPVGPGTQFRRHERAGRKIVVGISEVVDFVPSARVTSRLISRSSESLILTSEVLTLEPSPTGALLQHQLVAETNYNSALVGFAVFLTLMKPTLTKRYTAGWVKVKQILESSEFDRQGVSP